MVAFRSWASRRTQLARPSSATILRDAREERAPQDEVFETHRWNLSSGARSRDPLPMRLGEDADMIRTSKTLY
jgi:hypothetical protein